MAADRPAPRDGQKRAVVVHSYGDSERGIFVTGRLLACGYAVVPARGSGITALDEATASFPGLPIAHLGQPRDVRALARAAASLRRRVSALASIGEPLGLLLDEADGLAVPTLVVADSATWGMRRRVRRALPRGSRVVRAGDFEAALLAAIGFFDEWAHSGLRPRTAPRRSARRLAPAALLAAPSTLLMAAPAAQAAAACGSGVDGDTLFITCAGEGDVSIEIGVSADGEILVNRESKASLGEIKFVKVESKASNTLMLLDEQDHKFGTGLGTLEDPFVPIQLDLNFEGNQDTLVWVATEGDDQFKLLPQEIDVTGGGIADHKVVGLEYLKFDLLGGDDHLDGGDSQIKLLAAGGPGDDFLIGGSDDDTFKISAGRDVLDGGSGWNKLELVSDNTSIKLGDSVVSLIDDGSETSYKQFQELSYLGGISDNKIAIDGYKLSKLDLDGGGGINEIKLVGDDSLVTIADTSLKLGDTGLDTSFKQFAALSYLGGALDSKVELNGIKLLKLDLNLGDGLDQIKLLTDDSSVKLGDGLIELGDTLNTIKYLGTEDLSYLGGISDNKIAIDGYKLSKLDLDGGGGINEIKLVGDDSLVTIADTSLKLGDTGLDTSFKQFAALSYLGGALDSKVELNGIKLLKLDLNLGDGLDQIKLLTDDSSVKLGDGLIELGDTLNTIKYLGTEDLSYLGGISDNKIAIDGYKLSKLDLDGGGGINEIKLVGDDSLVTIADTSLKLGDTGLDTSFKQFAALSYLGGALDSKVELNGIKLLKLDLNLGDGLDQIKLLTDDSSVKLGDGLIELGDTLNTIKYLGTEDLSYLGGISDNKIAIDGYKLSKLDLDGGGGINEIKLVGDDSLVTIADTSLKLGDTGLDTSFKQFASLTALGGDSGNKFDGSKVTSLNLTFDGGRGNDVLLGGLGADKIRGGLGNDQAEGGGGIDTLFEEGDVNFTLTSTSLTGLGLNTFKGFESLFLVGGAHDNVMDASRFKLGAVTFDGGTGDDVLIGSPYADKLFGSLGDDELTGNQGDDSLYAGAGDDHLNGSAGTDFGDGGPGDDIGKSIELKVNLEG